MSASSPQPGVRRQYLTPLRVNGSVRVGHTADLADPEAPILVHERPVLIPPGGELDSRCKGCVASVTVARDGDQVLVILEHKRGCPVMARWLRAAGVAS
jgi:hypothetical protein